MAGNSIIHFLVLFLFAVSLKTKLQTKVEPYITFPFIRYSTCLPAVVACYQFQADSLRPNLKIQLFVKPKQVSSITLLIIILSGDIQLNPGPSSIYPCGYCELPVTWNHFRAVCCDNCSLCYHSECIELSSDRINLLQYSNISWICCKCDSQNVDSFTYHSYEFEVSNRFSLLSNLSSIPSVDSNFSPKAHSSPIHIHNSQLASDSVTDKGSSQSSLFKSHSNPNYLTRKKQNFRVLLTNCQSVRNKRSALQESTDYIKPDVILGCESWLSSEHSNAEIFPDGYHTNVFRKDRNKNGGGVFIAAHDSLTISEVSNQENNSEIIWAEIQTVGKPIIIGSYYRPPNAKANSLNDLALSLQNLKKKQNKHIILGGDFNLPHINWKNKSTKSKSNQQAQHRQLIDIIQEQGLEQMQMNPSRENNILDLYFTNYPSLVKSCDTVPGISDHHMVVIDSDLKTRYNKPKHRKLYIYKRANWDNVKTKLQALSEYIIQSSCSVEAKWDDFKKGIFKTMEDDIPCKWTNNRSHLPWLSPKLRNLIKKKHKLMYVAKKSGNRSFWSKYKQHKSITQKLIRQAHWNYVNHILDKSLEEGNNKSFWKYVKAKRNDNIGVAALKDNGTLHHDSKTKANLLNRQFKSVFTKSDENDSLPTVKNCNYPSIENITINVKGVENLLSSLKVNKASGPDNIPNMILKTCSKELSPALTNIFQQSLDTGTLPRDWKNANVCPIFKKGNKHMASNYRPVSLTSVCCKILEHIICKHILNHLDKHNILTSLQHGFRSNHSCESQLVITMHDIMQNFDNKKQTDLIILDFSKAFDTVPHNKLLFKLNNYGIDGKMNNWIQSFLTQREQQVIIEGESSSPCSVDSGVPQGTVLGPLLFLCHINDLPQRVKSQVRLFADDCLLYRQIHSITDQILLQQDLIALEAWAKEWGMRFNASKCYLMSIHRSKKPHTYRYKLDDHLLEQVEENPYLGVTIHESLKWESHINKISSKANSVLGFIKRNLKYANQGLKETAYISLVRSVLEFSSTVWDPFYKKDIDKLERIQRRAARFIFNDYSQTSSVTDMLLKLDWKTLAQRRRECRLSVFYKIINGLVAIPADTYLQPNTRNTRTGNTKSFRQPGCTTDIFKHSFFPATIRDWNLLPDKAVRCKSLESFKATISEARD